MWLVWGGRQAIRDVQSRMEALERSWKDREREPKLLRTEWEATLDKMNAVMARLNQRIRASEVVEDKKAEEVKEDLPPRQQLGTHGHLAAWRARRGM